MIYYWSRWETITTGYRFKWIPQYGYCFNPIQNKTLSQKITALSNQYSEYKNFNIKKVWENACLFEHYARQNPSIFITSHDETLKTMSSVKNTDDFKPLHWIREINDILQKDATHKVAKLSGLWLDCSILIAINCNKDIQLEKDFNKNSDKFNWRRVLPLMTDSDKPPEVISVLHVEGPLSCSPVKIETSCREKPDPPTPLMNYFPLPVVMDLIKKLLPLAIGNLNPWLLD